MAKTFLDPGVGCGRPCVFTPSLQLELRRAVSRMVAAGNLKRRVCGRAKAVTCQGASAGRYLRLLVKPVKHAVLSRAFSGLDWATHWRRGLENPGLVIFPLSFY